MTAEEIEKQLNQRHEEAKALMAQQFETWKQSAVTQAFVKILTEREARFADAIANQSIRFDVEADIKLRVWAVQLQEIKNTKAIINDANTFTSLTIRK